MSLTHAVVWVDHQSAQVLRFDAEHIAASKIRAHTYHTCLLYTSPSPRD